MAGAVEDRFLEACGAAGPLRLGLSTEGASAGLEVGPRILQQPFAVVGRDPVADVVLDDPEVSRRHVYLQLIEGRLFGVDLRSRTGTRWADGPASLGWVEPWEALGIGPYRIRFEGGPEDWLGSRGPSRHLPPPTSRAFAQPDLVEVDLECLNSGFERPTWRINRALILVGRSPACKVRLLDDSVSKFDCALVRTPAGLWVVDLLSREGILVNGKWARLTRLERDDIVQAGSYRFAVRIAGPGVRPSGARGLPPPSTARRVGPPASMAEVDSLTPSPLVPGLGADRPELRDPQLVPLFNELGQMQQQMADQFQQALLAMFQMFGGMHRDQMALIREELARIQHLTEEKQALQAELGRRSPAGSDPAALRLFAAEPRAESAPGSAANPPPSRAETASRREEPAPAPARAPGPEPRRDPEATPKRPAQPRTDEGQDAQEIHAALVRRLAAIQDEQEGRWQKLLGSVMGRGPGRSTR